MTQQPTNQPSYTGAPGPGGYPQQDQIPGQNPYGQQPQYGAQNPYGQGQPQNPYGTPPKKKTNKRMLVRLGVFVVVLAIAGSGYAVKNANKADRNADGNISKQGNLDAFSIKVNDCYEKPKAALTGF